LKVLVTGARGLIGAELCEQLFNKKHEVWGIDDKSRSDYQPMCHELLEWDLTIPLTENFWENLLGELNDFDYIFHFAAINGTTNFYSSPNKVLRTNALIDLNMFEWAQKQQEYLKGFIYASSSEVVSGDPSPVAESININIENIHNPRWSYRLPKVMSENYLANSNLPWTIFRYFNVYGIRTKEGHFVFDQLDKINKGVYQIHGWEEHRTFCYVKDAVAATIKCAFDNRSQGEVINIGGDRELMILQAANIIAATLGKSPKSWDLLEPGKEGSTYRRKPDIRKLKEIMPEYAPIDFEEGIKKICEYYLQRIGT
jgi:UDP-glucose 4-epimerase